VALAERMLSMDMEKAEDDWLRRSDVTGNMVGFGYFGRFGLESVEGMMGNIVGGVEPIAWCG
jgi:hypothetical protein